jgi:hypothetical protein
LCLEIEAEGQKSKQELRVQFERQLSDLRNQANKELSLRDTKLIELQEELESKNREFQIWKERTTREIEIDLIGKYEDSKKEFERRLQEETVYTIQKQEELLSEKKVYNRISLKLNIFLAKFGKTREGVDGKSFEAANSI